LMRKSITILSQNRVDMKNCPVLEFKNNLWGLGTDLE